MTSVSLRSRTTTWVNEQYPSAHYWNKTGYMALNNAAGRRQYGYIWISMPFKRGVRILSATLRLKTRALAAMTNRTITVRGLNGGFATDGTWLKKPAADYFGAASVTKSGALPENTEWAFNVSTMMQMVADGQYWAGFQVETNDVGAASVLVQGHLMGNATVPTLDLVWSDAPLAPDRLSPSAGNAVGEPKPVVRFSFQDFSGDETMAACRVQIKHGSNNFATPTWDSGERATTIPQLDLDAAGYAGLPSGTTAWWRVQVKDAANIWSEWSVPASFTYYPLPTVVFNNPPVSGVVTDPTPPLDWSYTGTGSPQTAYRLGVYIMQGGEWVLRSASSKLTGTGSVWTPSSSIGPNGTYKAIVDVWDGRSREATAGFPTYASAERQFTYQFSGTVASPITGTAASMEPSPGIYLSWNRSTQPDRFVIFRDGKSFANYAAADLFISGTKYGITDRYPSPRTTHSYQIVAVVNGVSSNPLVVTGVSKPLGTWIGHPSGTPQLCIVNDKDRDVAFGEKSSVHEVVGSMAAVVITSGRRGYEGTLKGILRKLPQIPGKTAQDWKRIALDIKSNPGLYWVVWGDEAFRADLSNVQVVRSATLPDTYLFSTQFNQQDDFNYEV